MLTQWLDVESELLVKPPLIESSTGLKLWLEAIWQVVPIVTVLPIIRPDAGRQMLPNASGEPDRVLECSKAGLPWAVEKLILTGCFMGIGTRVFGQGSVARGAENGVCPVRDTRE